MLDENDPLPLLCQETGPVGLLPVTTAVQFVLLPLATGLGAHVTLVEVSE
jgi:hypothetical protein